MSTSPETIQRFTDATRAIREELPRAIPAALLGGRRFDSWAESGQVGGLRRQLEKKRGGMSIRALLDNFGELITAIMPCTLMSPDSVARFFPAKHGLFDVVVFDEASQVRVADAVGAMGRSGSVVVVGDSKQMPPTSFADVGAGDDDEDYSPDTVVDEESILTECVQSQVPRQWLSWHYRSQDEALIAFSNQNYYEGRLASFPAPHTAAGAGHGVSLVRVDGVFERSGKGKTLRTNRVEAERIVADIRRRFALSSSVAPSLGVVTFNAQQRDFIENLLRDAGDDRLVAALDEPDGLFVKNLENVQGDERDTILFSVAFSANDKGVVPLNFGPLSRPGGERRLNVAEVCRRSDAVTVWGVGCHPGVVSAQENYAADRFAAILAKAPFVGEVGLDGASRFPIDRQAQVFSSVLAEVVKTPRMISVHSYRATERVLDLIEHAGVEGAILHWWLGSEAETTRALDLGCIFSVNQSMSPDALRLAGVPITSLLPETDHPSGNRRGDTPKQPGRTLDVERAVASAYGVTTAQVRDQFWLTFADSVIATEVMALLPPVVQAMVSHALAK